jgi:acyl-CoA synthetase (AMP-forming)/AMP-acid ligase II
MYQVELTQSQFPMQTGLPLIEKNIGNVLAETAKTHASKTALVELREDGVLDRRWTYEELYRDSHALALALANKFPKGTRIAVWAPNSLEWVLLEYAAALAGLILVTVNPSFQSSEVKYVLEQSEAEALFLVESFRGNPIKKIADAVAPELSTLKEMVYLHELSTIAKEHPAAQSLPAVNPDDPVQIQYTSGTTGFPKGAKLLHRGLINNSLLISERMGMGGSDVYINFMPMFHTGGCGIGILCALTQGATSVIVSLFNPQAINAAIEQERATHMLAVPTMLVNMLEDLDRHPCDHSSMKGIICGGAMVSPELVKRAKDNWGCNIQIVYGQTEASPVVSQVWQDDSVKDQTETVGQALPHTELSIRDMETNAVLPLGEIGEICARGYSLMSGYNNNPEATRKTIDSEGWLHTGDLGTMDKRGYVSVTGRIKEMIIRGGENLFPAEIENAMQEHPAIAETAVVGLPDKKWGEVAGCFIRLEDSATPPSKAELVSHIRALVSPQKTPEHWFFVTEWPITQSGKIQKFKIRELYEKGGFNAI